MNNTLKVVIGVAAALVVGLVVGYVLGSVGKRDLASAAKREKSRAQEAETALKDREVECEQKARSARIAKQVLLAKEHLLRATVEMYANNYGLTSQQLGIARNHLKSSMRGMKDAPLKLAQELFEEMGNAQTLAMRLDPMARVHIERILAKLQKLPGAR
jgi:Tfp pilus assembly protein PilX